MSEHEAQLDFCHDHEIYLSDARKVAPEKWKTVIRHPVKKVANPEKPRRKM